MKLVQVLQSRKFWSAVIGLVVSVGILQYSDAQQADLVSAIVTVVTAVAYMFSIAVEDGMRSIGEAQKAMRVSEALNALEQLYGPDLPRRARKQN